MSFSPLFCSLDTTESQWEVPPGYQQPQSSVESPPVQEAAADTQETQTTTESNQDNTSDSPSGQKFTISTKRSVDETELESRDSHQPSKRRAGPYGAWNTVAVYERTEEEVQKESQGGEEEEGDSSEEDGEREDKLRFEEKTLGSLGRSEEGERSTAMVAGAFKGFGFKKRAGNRPQIRQLKTNDL